MERVNTFGPFISHSQCHEPSAEVDPVTVVAYRRHTGEDVIHKGLQKENLFPKGGYPLNLAHILELLRTV